MPLFYGTKLPFSYLFQKYIPVISCAPAILIEVSFNATISTSSIRCPLLRTMPACIVTRPRKVFVPGVETKNYKLSSANKPFSHSNSNFDIEKGLKNITV